MCSEILPSVWLIYQILSYVESFIVCNLEPLELRKIRMDLLFAYKLLHGCVKCNL